MWLCVCPRGLHTDDNSFNMWVLFTCFVEKQQEKKKVERQRKKERKKERKRESQSSWAAMHTFAIGCVTKKKQKNVKYNQNRDVYSTHRRNKNHLN